METETHTRSVPDARIVPVNLLRARQFLIFVIGLFIMCYGFVAVVKADFGVSPWDVLHLGISQNTGLSFGRVSQIVGLVILTSACIIMRKWPTFGCIANMILVGEFIDLILRFHLVPDWEHPAARMFLFAGGVMIAGLGTGVYIQSKLGAGPRDWLMLALHEKTGWAIRWVRTLMEVLAVLIGLWLGGPFSWGTLVFSLTIGHTTEFGLRISKKLFGRFTERGVVA